MTTSSKTSHHTVTFLKDGRIHSLDGLRAASILLVMLGHVAGTINAPAFLDPFHSLGNYGVRFFFLISGFLITHLLLKELEESDTINLKAFYIRRTLRIFPAYYTYIAIAALLAYFGWVDVLKGDLFHSATYTMNYHETRGWHLNHTWSLAVEEQFYLLWPLTLCLFTPKRAVWVLAFMLVCVPFIRYGMWYGLDASPSAMTRHFQAVADALALGCLLAFILRNKNILYRLQSMNRLVMWCVALGLLASSAALYLISAGLFYVVGQSVANFGVAVILYLCLTQQYGPLFWLLNNRVARYIGALSYSLYLWQEPFLNSYETHLFQSYPLNIALTVICALMSYYLIEQPFQKLKDKPFPILRLPVLAFFRKLRHVPSRKNLTH